MHKGGVISLHASYSFESIFENTVQSLAIEDMIYQMVFKETFLGREYCSVSSHNIFSVVKCERI